MEWYTASDDGDASARTKAAWADAPIENTELCSMLLDVAKVQVLEFAEQETPAEQIICLLLVLGFTAAQTSDVIELLDVDDAPPTPDRYVFAQLQQAKNLWTAGRVVTDDGTAGGEGFTYTPRPLDKTIQRIIRPTSGVADVF